MESGKVKTKSVYETFLICDFQLQPNGEICVYQWLFYEILNFYTSLTVILSVKNSLCS